MEELEKQTGHRVIPVSAKEETGIEELETDDHRSMFYQGDI